MTRKQAVVEACIAGLNAWTPAANKETICETNDLTERLNGIATDDIRVSSRSMEISAYLRSKKPIGVYAALVRTAHTATISEVETDLTECSLLDAISALCDDEFKIIAGKELIKPYMIHHDGTDNWYHYFIRLVVVPKPHEFWDAEQGWMSNEHLESKEQRIHSVIGMYTPSVNDGTITTVNVVSFERIRFVRRFEQ